MNVLFVCTGNICRSPMAEHLLRDRLAARGVCDVTVSSAGTRALVGEPMYPEAAAAIGVVDSAFRARQLDADLVAESDLVLTATRDHRATAVTLLPRAAGYTFTLRELDRLLSGVNGDLRDHRAGLLEAARAQRGLLRPDRPEDDDVADPYRGPSEGYRRCAVQLESALARLVDLLAV